MYVLVTLGYHCVFFFKQYWGGSPPTIKLGRSFTSKSPATIVLLVDTYDLGQLQGSIVISSGRIATYQALYLLVITELIQFQSDLRHRVLSLIRHMLSLLKLLQPHPSCHPALKLGEVFEVTILYKLCPSWHLLI